MNKRTIFLQQLLFTVAVFFFAWFALSQINFREKLGLENISNDLEESLAKLVTKNLSDTIDNPEISDLVEKVKTRICEKNDHSLEDIKIHIVKNDEINAFAYPDRNMVIYTGLIESCENVEELAGIMAHEMAHIAHNHVMKKLVKEIGVATLYTLTGGASSKEIGKIIMSTAYDREAERQADLTAVEYMVNANLDPENLANFMYRLHIENKSIPGLKWISTHPDSEARSKYIIEEMKKHPNFKSEVLVDEKEWKQFQLTVKSQ